MRPDVPRREDFCPPQEEGCFMFRTHCKTRSLSSRRRATQAAALGRAVDQTLESLESRRLYSVTATAAGGVLTVLGDGNNNAITVSRDVAGNLLVNGGSVAITGSPANVGNIQTINVSGLGGNDSIALD